MAETATRLIQALRATLADVERTSGLPWDDPSVISLKMLLQQRIVQLEAVLAEETKPDTAD